MAHQTRRAIMLSVLLVALLAVNAQPVGAYQSPRLMVALVFGQSNAANFGESPHRSGPGVYNLYDGYLYYARDPLRGANGEGGSVWTRLGDDLIADKMYDAVIFIPAAVGGTEIARWAPDGDLHPLIIKAIESAQKRGLKITHLLWHQGESDAYLHTSKKDYEERFMAMLADIRAHGVDAPIFVSVATHCGPYPVNGEIQAAQTELVNPSLGIFAGPNTDTLGDDERIEGCHFSNDGLEKHAELWVQQLKAQADWETAQAAAKEQK
jgi:hypothetical protein